MYITASNDPQNKIQPKSEKDLNIKWSEYSLQKFEGHTISKHDGIYHWHVKMFVFLLTHFKIYGHSECHLILSWKDI